MFVEMDKMDGDMDVKIKKKKKQKKKERLENMKKEMDIVSGRDVFTPILVSDVNVLYINALITVCSCRTTTRSRSRS